MNSNDIKELYERLGCMDQSLETLSTEMSNTRQKVHDLTSAVFDLQAQIGVLVADSKAREEERSKIAARDKTIIGAGATIVASMVAIVAQALWSLVSKK